LKPSADPNEMTDAADARAFSDLSSADKIHAPPTLLMTDHNQ
jgi:hypothetical protein